MKKTPFAVLMLTLIWGGLASAQTLDDMQIQFGAYTQSVDGGEKPVGMWLGTGSLGGSKSTAIGIFSVADCGAFTLSVGGHLRENAYAAWKVQATVVRLVGDAVTFRLRSVRSLDTTKAFTEDVELTLRPGQSWALDSVAVAAGAKTLDGRPCNTSAASVRVLVDHHPSEDFDRRLVAADLWLVERLSNGTERTQPLAVRGLPNRPIPFYFESIVDGNLSLDIFGRLIARPQGGGAEVSLQTRVRWGEDWGRSVKSAIQVKPMEVVDVRLPKLEQDAGPFANRDLSIRVRVRQLR